MKYWAGKALSWAVLGNGQCVLATTRLKRHAVCRRAPPPHARTALMKPCSHLTAILLFLLSTLSLAVTRVLLVCLPACVASLPPPPL
eukprot:COSAG01_NODE_5550_length_4190_cov_48.559276_4_plen_87_part_00